MLGTFTLFDWPNLTTFSLFTEGEMLPKVVGPFFYFCYHVETEGTKAKLLKSGRIYFSLNHHSLIQQGFAKPLVPRVGLEPTKTSS